MKEPASSMVVLFDSARSAEPPQNSGTCGAIASAETPTVFALSRQGLPVWNPAGVPEDAVDRGAYILRYSFNEDDPDLILIGTGSEVHICTRAADLLEAEGIATRVVSMPCVDRFAAQDEAYKDKTLPPSCRARISVEAAATLGWERWLTDDGEAIGMTGFGASGPAGQLYEHFGFTPERIAERGRAVVERVRARGGDR